MTTATTSTGMPPITPAHDALDTPSMQGKTQGQFQGKAQPKKPADAVQSLVGEGKAQIVSGLNGVEAAVRDFGHKLDGTGAAPLTRYVDDAADTVGRWARTVDQKSVDDLIGDTRTLVRTSPATAVGLAVAAGFVVVRIIRSAR